MCYGLTWHVKPFHWESYVPTWYSKKQGLEFFGFTCYIIKFQSKTDENYGKSKKLWTKNYGHFDYDYSEIFWEKIMKIMVNWTKNYGQTGNS